MENRMGPKRKPPRYSLGLMRKRLMQAPPYAIIINAIHQRGPLQQVALEVLEKRGLWLTEAQKRQAGLVTEVDKRKV